MPEPGLNSKEAADFYTNGPSFSDWTSKMPPEQLHRYTQYRQALRENTIDGRVHHSPEELAKVRNQAQALTSIFVKPGTDEDALFDLMMEAEENANTDSDVEAVERTKTRYGSAYASPQAAQARMTPIAPTQTPAYSGNGRDVGFLERTYGTKDPTKIQQMAAKYAAQLKQRK